MNDSTAVPLIRYLNTDLDLVCDTDPKFLIDDVEKSGLYAHAHDGGDGVFKVLVEDRNDSEPEPNIIRLLEAIETLSEAGRRVWNRCSKRDFNIGYDCGDGPWGFNQGLSNQTLRRIVECGATVSITLYPFRPETEGEETS
ncbi:hypothetical protein [Fuerstiella marisgermanici]|uniref:DUF4279 domain-containing protein n=1 Tax=Fuerstiella marisgermanici TaxID=1891926 RepID=A0A1P8WQG2_9PLAN|nr:hypothetical protein [Fuerstiella marisgermanici]APZ96293.1 hypothetical protein Fuma_05961 [Fuerstiella marisgermanici]